MDYIKLITHYEKNYSSKIFMTKLMSNVQDFYIMYVYKYDEELENFSDTFLKYLPFYVRNEDYFTYLNEADDLDKLLIDRSKTLRKNSKIIPHRTIATDGIYGELFLDFYLRIVNKRNAILTYANKRSFDSNYETTGPDNIVYFIDSHNKINLCICEAKFVVGASNAKKCLIEDIVGNQSKKGHISKEYLNDYFQFIVEKGVNISVKDREIFKPFLADLNNQLDVGNNFINVIVEHNICVNFMFFAIFDSTKKEPHKLIDYYNEIYEICKTKIYDLGIINYKIEIVFIPTDNDTMIIKQEMEKAYE